MLSFANSVIILSVIILIVIVLNVAARGKRNVYKLKDFAEFKLFSSEYI
jgi:hypothetical protein